MRPQTRWKALGHACLGVSLLAAVLSCSDDAVPVDPGTPVFSHASPEMTPEVEQQLAELRSATARFHNFEAALGADYDAQLTICWFHRELGTQGYHYGNPALIDGAVELLEPELLVYEPKRNGSFRLVGIEYIVPIAAWEGASPPSLLGQEFHRNETLGLYVLHVWIWRHNPSGMFADWNPDVSCQYAAESEDRAP